MSGEHHLTDENARALITKWQELERGADGAWERLQNEDHCTKAGVAWRIMAWLLARAERAEARDDIRKYSDRLHNDTQDALVQQAARAERVEAAQRVPDGWRLVPVEPTPEMVEAICAAHTSCGWPNEFGPTAQAIRRQQARGGYGDALLAAPTATEPKGEQP